METNLNELLNSIHVQNNITTYALGDNEVVQCAFVRGGHLRSNYEDWVQNSKPCVRKLIAENYPEYVPLLPCETDWELIEVRNYLLEQPKPKIDILEKFLAKIAPAQNHNTEIIALRLKHKTMTREMTAIEKTMSLPQLWQADSPFWTNGLSGNEIADVLSAYCLSDKSREEFDFESVYDKVKNPLHRRLNSHTPFVGLDKELLNEEPTCNKILTPLIC